MTRQPDHWKARGLPGCPWWVPISVFVIVLIYVAYMVRSGLDASSAIAVTVAAAIAAAEIIRRLTIKSAEG